MSLPSRALIVTAAVALTLAACDRRERETTAEAPAPATDGAAVTPADGAAPRTYESENRFAQVELELPDAVRAQPDLHARLYAEAVRELRTFSEGA